MNGARHRSEQLKLELREPERAALDKCVVAQQQYAVCIRNVYARELLLQKLSEKIEELKTKSSVHSVGLEQLGALLAKPVSELRSS